MRGYSARNRDLYRVVFAFCLLFCGGMYDTFPTKQCRREGCLVRGARHCRHCRARARLSPCREAVALLWPWPPRMFHSFFALSDIHLPPARRQFRIPCDPSRSVLDSFKKIDDLQPISAAKPFASCRCKQLFLGPRQTKLNLMLKCCKKTVPFLKYLVHCSNFCFISHPLKLANAHQFALVS
jgi:hypothetical protein